MGFIGINEQNKQRVNISNYAYNIILQDISDFKIKNINTLVNSILLYEKMTNNTTVSELGKFRNDVVEEMKDFDSLSTINGVVDYLVDKKKTKIIEEHGLIGTHKRNGQGFYIRLGNNIRRWLESNNNHEDEYYLSLEHYINYKLEIYVKKSSCERESIILNDIIEKIEGCITSQKWLDIFFPQYATPNRVFPIKILSDKTKLHMYVACYRLTDSSQLIPATYRLSSLNTCIDIADDITEIPSEEATSQLFDYINERGIQFLTDPAIDISVRLTKYGCTIFNRTSNLRPNALSIQYLEKEDIYIYNFHCTARQAEYYFQMFGRNAEIVSPKFLRERFLSEYKAAMKLYEN